MEKGISLILTGKKKIRGEEFDKGTVLFVGECAKGFRPADLDKAIQLKEVRVEPQALEGDEKKSKPAKSAQNQAQK